HGLRVEVVGMLVADEHEVDAVKVAAAKRRRRHSDVRPVGRLVFSRQMFRQIQVDREQPTPRLDQKTALSQPPDPKRARARRRTGDLLQQIGLVTDRFDHSFNSLRTMRTPSTSARALATATCRAVWEKPQSGVTDTRAGSTYPTTVRSRF